MPDPLHLHAAYDAGGMRQHGLQLPNSGSPDGSRLAFAAISGVIKISNGIFAVRSSDGGGLSLIKSCPPACRPPGDFSSRREAARLPGSDRNDELRIFTIKLNGGGMTPSRRPAWA